MKADLEPNCLEGRVCPQVTGQSDSSLGTGHLCWKDVLVLEDSGGFDNRSLSPICAHLELTEDVQRVA